MPKAAETGSFHWVAHAPTVEELTAPKASRPYFDSEEKNPRCPYCNSAKRWHAREVKRNLQTGRGDEPVQKLRAELTKHIEQNALFRMFARPRKLTPLLLSRYDVGREYGTHVDDAIISGLRTDLSFTLFLALLAQTPKLVQSPTNP